MNFASKEDPEPLSGLPCVMWCCLFYVQIALILCRVWSEQSAKLYVGMIV